MTPEEEREVWVVRIRDNETGEIADHINEYGRPDGNVFIWEEGNFACDCNRALFFARAQGKEDPDCPCGDERYTIVSICRGNELLYSEVDSVDMQPVAKAIEERE